MWTEIWELQPPGTLRACTGIALPFFYEALYEGYPEIKDEKWMGGEGKSLL
jgi:hypothetical protein